MDAIEALTGRVSVPRLVEPAPSSEQLETLFQAALRAPDHAMLRPWRFVTITGASRERLGELYARAAQVDQPDLEEEMLDRYRGLPLRAPMLVALVLTPQQHPKVPEIEQVLSLGAACHGMMVAAHAMGIGAMWRTGAISYHPLVAEGLGLTGDEKLYGFMYLGTPDGVRKKLPQRVVTDFVSAWPEA